MSRETKFRGKRVDNGEWIYGYFFKTPLTDEATGAPPESGWSFLSDGKTRWCISTETHAVYEVDPETVGQYTGLKDKNGVEIYEGDLVENKEELDVFEVEKPTWFHCDACDCYGYEFASGYFTENYGTADGSRFLNKAEVIGNIYSNPDLLKEGDD